MVWTLAVGFNPEDERRMKRWKQRVSSAFETELTWDELLLAYANDPNVIPKRPEPSGVPA